MPAAHDEHGVSLDALGERICIMGPSNSGKSTLADSIGRARKLRIVHLDQFRHRPRTQWELRPDEEFAELHEEALRGDRWVIDGNYSALLPERLARATGLILLDVSAGASLVRYFRRTWRSDQRIGGQEGITDRVQWDMVRFILGQGQTNRREHRAVARDLALAKMTLPNRRAIERFRHREGLEFRRNA